MTKTIIWVEDDFDDDKGVALQILNAEHSGIVFEKQHPSELIDRLSNLQYASTTDGFLVDYNLKVGQTDDNRLYSGSGISFVDELRSYDVYANAPVFLVSASIRKSIPTRPGERADYFFKNEDLINHSVESVLANFQEYFKATDDTVSTAEEERQYLISHTSVPGASKDQLLAALPRRWEESSTETIDSFSTIKPWRRVVQWMRYKLFREPGPLSDQFVAACRLGLTQESLAEVSEQSASVRDLRYQGLFSTLEQPLWWSSELISLRAALDREADETGLAKAIASRFDHAAELAVCELCGESGVDTFAYDRDDDSKRYPAHASCTTVEYDDPAAPGFDLRRYLLDDYK